MHPLPRPLTQLPVHSLLFRLIRIWFVKFTRRGSRQKLFTTSLPALLEFLCLFCCFSPASSASLPRFPLYLTALYASADSGMQTSRKEVSALASQATTLATDTSTEWEREGERDKKGVRQADSMCVYVCGCVEHAQLLVLQHTLSKANTNSIGNFATLCKFIPSLYMQIVQLEPFLN